MHFLDLKGQLLRRNYPKTPTTVGAQRLFGAPWSFLPGIFLILKICPKLCYSMDEYKCLGLIYLPILGNIKWLFGFSLFLRHAYL